MHTISTTLLCAYTKIQSGVCLRFNAVLRPFTIDGIQMKEMPTTIPAMVTHRSDATLRLN